MKRLAYLASLVAALGLFGVNAHALAGYWDDNMCLWSVTEQGCVYSGCSGVCGAQQPEKCWCLY